MAASQNGFNAYKLTLHKKIHIIQESKKKTLDSIISFPPEQAAIFQPTKKPG
jgi:hypothetical protein